MRRRMLEVIRLDRCGKPPEGGWHSRPFARISLLLVGFPSDSRRSFSLRRQYADKP